MRWRFVLLAMAVPVICAGNANGQNMRKACLDADFVWTETQEPDTGRAENAGLEFVAAGTTARQLVLLGPVLGSMDESKVTSTMSCTDTGAVLTLVSTRSREFAGGVHKNVLRRSRIVITTILRKPEIHVQAVWKMQLPDGTTLERAQTPPYPELRYPLRAALPVRQ